MPGGPDEDAPAESDPDVDWVQDLKPVGGGTLTADPEADPTTEDKTAEAKPKRRTKKTTKRARRRKLETPSRRPANSRRTSGPAQTSHSWTGLPSADWAA
ncbi:hypothetical protein GCM10029992_06410 [Glycomyces albus]